MQRLGRTLMDHLGPAIAGTCPTQTIIPPSLEHCGGGSHVSPGQLSCSQGHTAPILPAGLCVGKGWKPGMASASNGHKSISAPRCTWLNRTAALHGLCSHAFNWPGCMWNTHGTEASPRPACCSAASCCSHLTAREHAQTAEGQILNGAYSPSFFPSPAGRLGVFTGLCSRFRENVSCIRELNASRELTGKHSR